jgi:hypothetical protein
VLDRCKHVVASHTDDGGWNYSPFEHAPLPVVPEEFRRIEPTTEDWHEVFGTESGDVIAQAYTDCGCLLERPQLGDERDLFLLMLERQQTTCESSSWEVPHWYTSSFGNDYFSKEPERILRGIAVEVAWLVEGLDRLLAILRARHPEETTPLPGARYLLDVPETDYRSRRAGRLICGWFIENPAGSTRCLLSLLGSPAAHTFALHFEIRHAEFPESLLFAELPRTVANDHGQLFEVLRALFHRNGAEDQGYYLFKCPPHAVSVGEVLDEPFIKRLITASAEVRDYIGDTEIWWKAVVQ